MCGQREDYSSKIQCHPQSTPPTPKSEEGSGTAERLNISSFHTKATKKKRKKEKKKKEKRKKKKKKKKKGRKKERKQTPQKS